MTRDDRRPASGARADAAKGATQNARPASDRRGSVLVVDDELQMAEMLADGLVDRGYRAVALASSAEALAELRADRFDVLVTDLRMPKVDGLELLASARRIEPDLPVIVMTAYGAIDSAIESIREGAYHYLTKPFKLEELAVFVARAIDDRKVRREASALRSTLRSRFDFSEIVSESGAMRDVMEVIERVVESDVPVLLTGETGTGKGLVARTLHAQGPRATSPFVTVNCAALPEALLESELFGHVRGAFTGAVRDRQGLLVDADGGTLFLDEIGEMSQPLQAKILDVIERRRVRAVGASGERDVDIRIIAATHRDLEERVRTGAFREDLFYRLDVVRIDLPPLRHRREDLPLLVERFFRAAKQQHPTSPVERLGPDAIARLLDHTWPGNVRELAHTIERLVVLGRSPAITADELPAALRATPPPDPSAESSDVLPIREVQRRYAAWALAQLGGHRTKTAEKLGIDLKTLAKWLSDPDER